MELRQIQTQTLSQLQLQSISLLQMSTLELESYILELSLENPVIDLREDNYSHETGEVLLQKAIWLEENDRQDRYYSRSDEEDMDPLARVGNDGGLGGSLFQHLIDQLRERNLPAQDALAVRFLAASLDENGYLSDPWEDLCSEYDVPRETMERALSQLQSLDPPGVGARDVRECLALQLRRAVDGGCAEKVVWNGLPAIAGGDLRGIARKLKIPLRDVERAVEKIRDLDPYPCRGFWQNEETVYVRPDVIISAGDNGFFASSAWGDAPYFTLNSYYLKLYKTTDDPELKKYLSQKLQQAKELQWATDQRNRTLLRCAHLIAEKQRDFFERGPRFMRPLRMADAAAELEVNVSTVSRAIRLKYVQCDRGLFPMSYFFSRAVVSGTDVCSSDAAREALCQLIEETPALSDQKLSEKLAEQGITISRRTVAKYRNAMGLPKASRR